MLLIYLVGQKVQAQCSASFDLPSKICLGDTLFINTGPSLVYEQWDLGNSDTISGGLNYVYASTGIQIIRHIIEDASTCRDTAYDTVLVLSVPSLSFTTDQNCTDDSVNFSGSITKDISDTLNIKWFFGDGDSSSLNFPNHRYPKSGTYSLQQIITGTGCQRTLDTSIFIKTKPTASFTYSGSSCLGDSVQFNSSSQFLDATLRWNFGDAFSGQSNTDSIANPKHRFSLPGTYTVRLVVTDSFTCRDTALITFNNYSNPSASFSASNTCEGVQTAFTNSSTSSAGDTLTAYYWSFGDGNSSSLKKPINTFSDTGHYTVQLIVESNSGCLDTQTTILPIFQLPIIQSSVPSLCIGSSLSFSVDSGTDSVSSYSWAFGDGFSGTGSAPTHQYNSSGTFKPSVKSTFINGAFCRSDSLEILVNPLPDASFSIDEDTLCFNSNLVCVRLENQASNIKTRRVLFDDGFVDVATAPNDTFVCHSYLNTDGGLYSLTVQLIDSNSCSHSFTSPEQVLIYPEIAVDFAYSTDEGCFETDVQFTNLSNQNPPEIIAYTWDFGDGTTNSSNWSSPTHTYSSNGNFTVKLTAQNNVGCIDSSSSSGTISNTSFTVDAHIDSLPNTCVSTNRIYVSQTPIAGATIQWNWGGPDTGSFFTSNYRYTLPGIYYPTVYIDKNGCDTSYILDTISISGPLALINPITNRYQCEIFDTVYANNGSNYFMNVQRRALWDFGDPFAASCTTTIDDGSNCRYSIDSLIGKHMYQKGEEDCYYIRLIAYDSVLNCGDTVISSVSLDKPNAAPDPSLFLDGLQILKSKTCLGPEEDKTLEIDLTETQPTCGRQTYWVMWDSTCAAQSSNFDSFWVQTSNLHNYTFDNPPCDTNGFVTIGLIIQNGQDSSGNFCRDTAWYHNILQFELVDPSFTSTYDASQYYCEGVSFDFTLTDTVQPDVQKTTFYWGDGTFTTNSNTNTVSHQFDEAGTYLVISELLTNNGCTSSDTLTVNVGLNKGLSVSSNNLCFGDTLYISPSIYYFNDPYDYFGDSSRITAGKEEIRIDIGDGNGFQYLGSNPIAIYSGAGNYYLRVALKDSTGCRDTLEVSDTIRVFGSFANFETPDDSFVCPQAIAFTDLSTAYDSSAGFIQPGDAILSWTWTFGGTLASSVLSNPEIYMSAGDYNVKLLVTNTIGCKDSVIKSLNITGPKAYYTITGDTTGCLPASFIFVNQSTNANSYVWSFKDSLNNTLITSTDSAFTFTYESYGLFQPTLTAQGNYVQNGLNVTCEDVFPDSTEINIRLLAANETPIAEFESSTNCAAKSATFTQTATITSTTLTQFFWEFGDGDTSWQVNPTHVYADTGHYQVILHVFSADACEDTVQHEVIISPNPSAYFIFNEVCLGSTTLFTDSTDAFNDIIYDWQWSFGDGASSTLQDPFHDFAKDSTYEVSLLVTNIAGCRDTSTQSIRIHSYPTANFSVNPVCDYDSSSFINSSSNSELPLTYTWTFGDAGTSNSENPKHQYASAAVYSVKLHAVSQWGCADSVSKSHTVYASPISSIQISDTIYCEQNQSFVYTDISTYGDGNTTRLWNFGDAATSSDSIATHSYSTAGNYALSFILSSDLGCYDTSYQSIRVDPSPTADFDYTLPNSCLENNQVNYYDLSTVSSGSLSRTWTLGDATTKNDSNFSYQYSDTGTFIIKLVINSDLGCSDSLSKQLYINANPAADFIINEDSQCLSGNQFIFTNTSSINHGNLASTWQFGDGYSAGLSSPSHSYALDSNYSVQLIVRSDSFCYDTALQSVVVHPMPVAGFHLDTNSLCLYANTFNATDTSSIKSGTLSNVWHFGDGDSATTNNASHSYLNDGTYYFRLQVESSFGCVDTLRKSLNVRAMPQPGWTINDSTQCLSDNSFVLTDTSIINSGSFTQFWTFGDGDTSSLANPTKTYSSEGTYSVQLLLESNFGCKDSLSRDHIVYPQPEASFSVNDTNQCLRNNSFVFSNLSSISSGTMTYGWEFGDGDSVVQTAPTHSYTTHGVYSIRLYAESNFGCLDSAFLSTEVFPQPKAIIGITDSTICYRDHVFDYADSSELAYGLYSRQWDFGDGSTDTNKFTQNTYASHGVYNTELLVVSEEGCRDSVRRDYEVYPQAYADFTVNDSIQCFNGHSFQFTNLSTLASGVLDYTWDFNDLSSSTQEHPTKQYLNFGTYTVRLISNTTHKCADTTSHEVRIDPNPKTDWTVNDSGQCINAQNFFFTDKSTIGSGSYTRTWDFGDAYFSTSDTVTHFYYSPIPHDVKLVLVSDSGCTDSLTKTIFVHPKPIPDFVINDDGQCLDLNDFQYTNQSGIYSGTMTHRWFFGDGDSAQGLDAQHSYAYDDTFHVTLISTSDFQCIDSNAYDNVVYPKPEVSFTSNDSAQCINVQNFQFTGTATISSGGFAHYYWILETLEDTGDLDTSYYYANPGTYATRFIAQSQLGCLDTAMSQVVVHPKPHADFSVNDSDQCVNTNQFLFTNNSTISAGTLSYLWDFGDGSASTDPNPSQVYLLHDSLDVILYAISDLGCYDTTQHEAIILPKPELGYVVNDTGQCLNGNLFTFTNNTTIDYGTLSYLWDMKDGTTSSTTDFQHIYATHNTYLAQLKATSDVGCTDSLITPLVVFPKPAPDFTVNDFGQCFNEQQFNFTDQSGIAYGNLHWRWDFGDLQEDTNTNVNHVYSTIGIYSVELLLTTDFNCVDSITKNVQVLASPKAIYTVNDTGQCINTQDFQFASQSTIDQGSIQFQNWTFDDGGTDAGTNVLHHYINPGDFQSKLVVISDSACTDTASQMIRVIPKPSAAFDYNDSAQCLSGNDYQFHSLGFDSSGILAWHWNIHNLTSFTDSAPSYVFSIPGQKNITHQVLGNDGCKDTVTRSVYVKPMPDPAFSGLKSFHCENEPVVVLTPVTSGGTFTGKNIVNQQYLPRLLWQDTVRYWVEVNGCADSSYQYPNVYPLPQVDLGPDTTLCKTEYIVKDVNFFGCRYLWSDGSINALKTISKEGTYWVELENMCGITRDEFVVSFQSDNCRVYAANSFTPNEDSFNDRYKPITYDVDTMTYEIYNRWGQRVYSGNIDDSGWDGTFANSPVEQDVYVVVIRYEYKIYDTQIIGFDRVNLTLLR